MQTLDVLVGSTDPLIHEWLERHIASRQPLLDTIVHPELPAQVAMLLLRLSVVPLLGYLTRVIRPSLLAPHARRFDEMVLDTAQRKFALPSPLPDAAVLTLTQPIRSGGFGLSKAAAVSVPAYFCALSAASDAIMRLIPGEAAHILTDEKMQAPFAREAGVCLTALIDAGVVHGPDGPIPSDIADFWLPDGRAADLPRRQHAICSQLAERDFNAWYATASLKAKQRFQSASATNAGSWLTTFPTTPELTMADEFFVLAVKHRLGLRPIADLPAKCTCGAKLSDDSQHFYSCGQLKRKAMTVRHDAIVRLLRDSFHHVGAVVHVEPRLYDTKRVRPDLDTLLPDVNMMLDVAVTHPGAPSPKSDLMLCCGR